MMLVGAQLRSFHRRWGDTMTRRNGVFWAFFVLGAVLLTSLVARLLPQTEGVRMALLFWQQSLFILGGLFGARRGVFRSPNRKEATYGVVGGLGLYVVNIVLGVLSVWIALRFLDPDLVQNLILRERAGANVLLTSNEPLIVLGTMLLLTVGAPLGEELFFRGLLVDLWRETLGARAAILLGAVLFAFLHFYVLQFIPVLISGIVLGILLCALKMSLFLSSHSVVNSLVLVIWLWAL